MKGFSKQLIAGAALLTSVGVAQADVSGEIALTSDYRFRGISQTAESAAVQGGLEYGVDSGFYAGVWASSIGFTGGGIEFDPYVGFAGSTEGGIDYDIGAIYFYYPEDGAGELDFWEFYGSVGFMGATLGAVYSPDYFAETDRYYYVYGSYDIELPEGFGLGFQVGSNILKDSDRMDEFLGLTGSGESAGKSYTDWSVTVSKSAYDLDFSLAYIDTDLSKDECFLGSDDCGATAVFTVAKSL